MSWFNKREKPETQVIHVYQDKDVNGVDIWVNIKTGEKYYHQDLWTLGAQLGYKFVTRPRPKTKGAG